jgi:hypothetical protein
MFQANLGGACAGGGVPSRWYDAWSLELSQWVPKASKSSLLTSIHAIEITDSRSTFWETLEVPSLTIELETPIAGESGVWLFSIEQLS